MPTKISWCTDTWNPVTGCSRVSEGCRNCYAAALAPRLAAMGQKGYTDLPWTKKNAEQNVHLHPDRLDKPLRWKKPRRVFVNSMSDLFHELVPFEFVAEVFRVMAGSQRHTFQVLTKRPERMASFVGGPSAVDHPALRKLVEVGAWPPPNVWLGTSVENQKAADERIPHLLRTPAAVRFLSCEPLLGPVDLMKHYPSVDSPAVSTIALTSTLYGGQRLHLVDWVIAGGESGRGFRPMDMDWARSLRDQCERSEAAFFFKQDSGIRPETNALLDGEEWHQFPRGVAT